MALSTSSPKVKPLDWARQAQLVDPVLREIEHQVKLNKKRRLKKVASATTLGLAVVLFWALPYFQDTGTISTLAANRQSLALADGSRAELNARTTLKTDFRYGRRTVTLTAGEAFFSVAKDPGHPFLVETPSGTVRVTGTQFNVRLEPGRVEVTLLEGSVDFHDGDTSVALLPSQQLTSGDAVPRTLSSTQLDNATAWRSGRLVLAGLTLSEACARFSAYHARPITVPAALASVQLGGACPLDDLKGFLAVLTESLPVSVVTRPDGSLHLVPR